MQTPRAPTTGFECSQTLRGKTGKYDDLWLGAHLRLDLPTVQAGFPMKNQVLYEMTTGTHRPRDQIEVTFSREPRRSGSATDCPDSLGSSKSNRTLPSQLPAEVLCPHIGGAVSSFEDGSFNPFHRVVSNTPLGGSICPQLGTIHPLVGCPDSLFTRDAVCPFFRTSLTLLLGLPDCPSS